MFARYLGPERCGRCFLPLIEGDQAFILETDSGDDVHFCYECGIKELSECHGLDPIAADKFWHDKFQKPGSVNEPVNPDDIH